MHNILTKNKIVIVLGIMTALTTMASFDLSALDPTKAVTQYMIGYWNDETGLPQNNVRSILQTKDGYTWIGTEEGLARFDGVKFTLFNESNTPLISKNYISCLFQDSRGNLWIGTVGSGLLKYESMDGSAGKFSHYGSKEGLTHDVIYCITEDKNKILWVGTDGGGLYSYDGKKFTHRTTTAGNDLPDNSIHALCFDHRGTLWIGTGKGLTGLYNNRYTSYSEKDGISPFLIKSILPDSKGNLWIGGEGGLYRRSGDKFERPQTGLDFEEKRVYSIMEDRDSNIWFGTASLGLARFTFGKYSILTKNDGLSDNTVISITGDMEGNLWVGTAYGGINRIKDGKFASLTTKEGLSEDIVFPIYEDRSGYLWIGTNNGLNRYKDGNFLHVDTSDGLSNNVIDSITEDAGGNTWVGTDDGVNLLQNSPSRVTKISEFCRKEYILSIGCDNDNNIWIGTLKGIMKINPLQKKTERVSLPKGLDSNAVNIIHKEPNGTLWISVYRFGLLAYKNGSFTAFTPKNGLAGDSQSCIYQDRDSLLWIGSNQGLTRFKNGRFKSITQKEGLFNNNIYQILEDQYGFTWMSCNKGIFKVNKKELNEFFENKRKQIKSIAYGKDDGMITNECNGGFQSAGCRTSDGKLWFPTTKGVVTVDPGNIPVNPIPPPILIEEILLDGIPLKAGQPVVLRPGVKRMDIHFTALSFSNPKRVQFKYKLDGYDEQWINAENQRTAAYTNLDGGNYRFYVTACNDDGIWNPIGAYTQITVIPPLWKTWWFTIIALILFSAVSYFIIQFFRKYFTMANFWKRQKYVGNFKLLEKIGAGGMGSIYKAMNMNEKGEAVAIKLLREELFSDETNVKRFKQEAAIIDQLDHPNIVKVLERGQSRNAVFIAMELLQGLTLAEKIRKDKKLELHEAVHIMVQVADALAKIHAKNIIHRDLKPENIMLIEKHGDPLFVKLLDFGLAKTQFQTQLTQTGVVIGTINYLSPEQICGHGSFPASDIYALGIIFYEMITGEKPFFGETTVDIMRQILDKSPIEPIRFRFDMSFELNHLTMRMLEKDVKMRPRVTDILEKLRTIDANLRRVEPAATAKKPVL